MPTCILAAAGEWVRRGRIGRLGCQNCRVFALIPITSFHMRPSAVPCLLLASRRRPRLLRSLQSTYLRYRHTGKPESVPVPTLIPAAATAPLLCRYTTNLPRTEKLSDAEKDTPSHFPNTVCVGFASYRRSVSNLNNPQDGLGCISSTIFILVSRLLETGTSLALSKQASQGVPRKAVAGSRLVARSFQDWRIHQQLYISSTRASLASLVRNRSVNISASYTPFLVRTLKAVSFSAAYRHKRMLVAVWDLP